MSVAVATEFEPHPESEPNRRIAAADFMFRWICLASSSAVPLLVMTLVVVLVQESIPFVRATGLELLRRVPWNPGAANPTYGGLALIYGTLVTAGIAMLLAIPIGVGAAAYLAAVAPRWLRINGAAFIELLAAIPSVVYGLWGLIVLAPWVGGPGILAAGLILAIMIVPYVTALSYSMCRTAPRSQCEAALALGATRWQLIRTVILPHARPGIVAAVFLALGRALGETMAVTMLIGNKALAIEAPIGGVGDSIASVVASQLNEATTDMQRSGLVALAFVLFLVTLVVNVLGRLLIRRVGRPARRSGARVHVVSAVASSIPDASGNHRQARRRSTVMSVLLATSLLATLLPVFLILGFIVVRGAPGLTLDFFTQLPAPPGVSGGGLAHALVGSARLVALAAVAAVPIGLLGGIALAEHAASRWTVLVRFVGELLAGVPSIIIGILGYSIIVSATDPPHFSAWAGSFALAVMMLPIVVRASEEAIRVVPAGLRQASFALGAGQFQTIVRVVLPAALPGIATGIVLAIARIAGETAPLLLTAYGSSFFARSFNDPTPFLPKYIYNYATSGFAGQEQQAWTAALVLLTFIIVISVGIRWFAARTGGESGAAD